MTNCLRLLLSAAMCLLTGYSFAQADVKSLEEALSGKKLALRNYSADPAAIYDWQEGAVVSRPPAVETLAIFQTRSIKRRGDVIRFTGDRSTLLRSSEGKLAHSEEVPMTLEINLHGADESIVVPMIAASVFFKSLDAAIAGVPQQFQKFIPWQAKGPSGVGKASQWVERDGVWNQVAGDDPRLRLAKVKSAPEPQYSEEARREKIAGSVLVALVVNESGHPEQLWIADPLLLDLDEKSIAAVKQYVFEPAQFEGKPVSTALEVKFSFQFH